MTGTRMNITKLAAGGVGEDVLLELLTLGRGHMGAQSGFWCRGFVDGGLVFDGPGEGDAEEFFVLRQAGAVDSGEFGEQGWEVGKAVGVGVGLGQGLQRRDLADGGYEDLAQARYVGELVGADEGVAPEAQRLALLAGTDELDEMAFE